MKRIFLSQRVEIVANIGERRDSLSQEWSNFAVTCGFLPVLLPNNIELARCMTESFSPDGIILTGGNDLVSYGGNAPERDETERFLIEYVIKRGLPLLGVCRGMQMLLDFFGTDLQMVEGHVRTTHTLDDGREVNSFHRFAAAECSSGLKATARSEDGSVEECVHEKYENIRGIMWHPERYQPLRKEDIVWIRRFFRL